MSNDFLNSKSPEYKKYEYRGNWYGTDTNFTVYKEDYVRSVPTYRVGTINRHNKSFSLTHSKIKLSS